uniref:Uncharacterized protein n=1 Tax=Paramoeba aestuarina TaxID=180227 RepID=A0A7S4JLZ4_9EUKA|mmetsp:Transcript_11454/g.17330  ORF Transcript_11454/g.17330 Transcript_11454/m.17330 type:complete len:284 (+) Transcript_11454:27-878(+)
MIRYSFRRLCQSSQHNAAHKRWKEICEHMNTLREDKMYSPMVVFAKIGLQRMGDFDANDCPPFYETALKNEMAQAYVKLGKVEEALTVSNEILATHTNTNRIEYCKARQNHGFLLLQTGQHADAVEAERIFQSILSSNETMIKDFPLEYIDYQKLVPVAKIGLGVSLALQGTRQEHTEHTGKLPPRIEIVERSLVEKALDLFYRTLPKLYDNEETFSVGLCLVYAALIHEAGGSIEKATTSLQKLKSWMSDHQQLQEDLKMNPKDVDEWIARVEARKGEPSKV